MMFHSNYIKNVSYRSDYSGTIHVDYNQSTIEAMADRLTKDDLKIVRSAVFDAAAKWYDLGIELGIPADRLDSIKMKENDNPDNCLRELVKDWLSFWGQEKVPTWKALCNALKSKAVGFGDMANKLYKEKVVTQEESQSKGEARIQSSVSDSDQARIISSPLPPASCNPNSLQQEMVGPEPHVNIKSKLMSRSSTTTAGPPLKVCGKYSSNVINILDVMLTLLCMLKF